MSVLSVKEQWRSNLRVAENGQRTGEVGYTVYTDTTSTRELDILNSSLVPRLYVTTHPGDQYAFARSFPELKRAATGSKEWGLTVEFKTSDQEIPQPIPWLRPARIRSRPAEVGYVRTHDKDGDPLKNSAGDLMEYPASRIVWVYTIEVNLEATFNKYPAWVEQYTNVINNDTPTFLDVQRDQYTLMIRHTEVGYRTQEGPYWYWPVKYEIWRDDANTWLWKPDDVGFEEIFWFDAEGNRVKPNTPAPPHQPGTNWKKERIADELGGHRPQPSPLDEHGQAILFPGDTGALSRFPHLTSSATRQLEFHIEDELPFQGVIPI